MEAKLKFDSEISCDQWRGGLRHKFNLNGCVAQIVEPPEPLEQKLWFWLPEWPTAFPERNGVKQLLEMGYYMVHIDVLGKCGSPEAVVAGETGILLEPGDVVCLAAALRTLAEDPELRARMGKAGRDRVREKFSTDRFFASFRAIWRDALAGR